MHHLHLDDLSRNEGKGRLIAGRDVAMVVDPAPDLNGIICHNCGITGHYKSGCAVSGKSNWQRGNGHTGKSSKSGGKVLDTTKK